MMIFDEKICATLDVQITRVVSGNRFAVVSSMGSNSFVNKKGPSTLLPWSLALLMKLCTQCISCPCAVLGSHGAFITPLFVSFVLGIQYALLKRRSSRCSMELNSLAAAITDSILARSNLMKWTLFFPVSSKSLAIAVLALSLDLPAIYTFALCSRRPYN